MNVKRIVTLLVLVVCATAIAVVPAFATTTNQVSITDLAVALSASDEVPDPRMFTEPWMFDTDDGLFPSDGIDYWFSEDLRPDPDDPNVWQLRGRGPHGGYTTTSAKCAVCHSAHNAAADEFAFDRGGDPEMPNLGPAALQPRGYALLRQGSTGCEYCHLTGSPVGAAGMWGMSSRIVYTSGVIGGESNLDPESGHTLGPIDGDIPKSDGTSPITNLTCSTCHAVHGNFGTWQPREFFRGDVTDPISGDDFDGAGVFGNNEIVTTLGYRMLRLDPGRAGNVPMTGDADPTSPATDQDQVNQFTLGTWCMSCHNDTDSMDKLMTSMRLPNGFTDFYAGYRTTAFTVTGSDVHSDVPFAVEYDYPNDPVDTAPHPTTFVGIYSGPGQCYTCHRGDLGGPLGEDWRWTTVAGVEIDEGEDVPMFEDGLARLRALGYFGISPNLPLLEQQAQLNQNMTCSGCHFGPADYALWAPRSDWPHSSPSTDRMLLGMELEESVAQGFENLSPEERTDIIAENFCSRCHVPDGEVPNSFLISRHFVEHSEVNLEGIEGILGILSPGNPPTPPAP